MINLLPTVYRHAGLGRKVTARSVSRPPGQNFGHGSPKHCHPASTPLPGTWPIP